MRKLTAANGRDRRIITDHQEAPASRIRPELCLNDERTQSYRRSPTHAYERSSHPRVRHNANHCHRTRTDPDGRVQMSANDSFIPSHVAARKGDKLVNVEYNLAVIYELNGDLQQNAWSSNTNEFAKSYVKRSLKDITDYILILISI